MRHFNEIHEIGRHIYENGNSLHIIHLTHTIRANVRIYFGKTFT